MTTTQTAFDPRTMFDPKAIYETWEKAASSWFETWSHSPAFLSTMGKTLEAQLGMKAVADRYMENALEAWKIPTAREIKAMGERIQALEERVASIEGNKAQAPAPKAAAKG